MRRDHLAWAVVTALAALLAVAALCASAVSCSQGGALPGGPLRFQMAPKDRPLLGSVRRVEDARSTGVALFWFDGILYVTRNLPREYVDYSAWCVMTP